MFKRALLIGCLLAVRVQAQTIQPIISEYTGKAEGKIALTNNGLTPMVVLMEPRSFSLNEQGKGAVRSLDSSVRVHLSTTSLKLAPGQTSYVFYEATAEVLPAWFTVYATFTSPRHGPQLDLRIMLPHTVYMYQKQPLRLQDVKISDARYDAEGRRVLFDLHNVSDGLGRVQGVHVSGGKSAVDEGSFPLLPGGKRHVEIAWKGDVPPEEVNLRFEHFKMSAPLGPTTGPPLGR
jgi:hypothetical protein